MKKPYLALLSCAALVLLPACGAAGGDDSGKPSVVASFYPYAWVAEQVGGDLVDVENLTAPGAEPHDLELKPKQVAAVQEADLVIFESGFQGAVDDAVEQADRSDDDTVDVADLTELKKTQPGGEEEHDHGDEEHAEDDGHGHDHGEYDPHVWLDPTVMVKVSQKVESELAAADPDHADTYAANAKALEGELTTLDADFTSGLKACERTTIVTSHAAFQYLADRYGLTQVPIAGIDPSNEPTAARLAEISSLVKKDGVTTIFTEELVSPAVARTVADETGVETATLDPIEGLGDATADETYLTLMQKNLATLQKANSCS